MRNPPAAGVRAFSSCPPLSYIDGSQITVLRNLLSCSSLLHVCSWRPSLGACWPCPLNPPSRLASQGWSCCWPGHRCAHHFSSLSSIFLPWYIMCYHQRLCRAAIDVEWLCGFSLAHMCTKALMEAYPIKAYIGRNLACVRRCSI